MAALTTDARATTLVAIDAPNTDGLVISGFYTFSGWALSDTSTINPNSIQLSISNTQQTVNLSGGYGAPRYDVCAAYPSWPPCNAYDVHVGWLAALDTTTITQGRSQTLTVTAQNTDQSPQTGSNQRSLIVDQPPTAALFATPPKPTTSGNGSGTFTFKFTTDMVISDYVWINGKIAGSLAATTQCSFSFWVNQQSFGLLNDDHTTFEWGPVNSGFTHSNACIINPDSHYEQGADNKSGTLTLDITFLPALTGIETLFVISGDQWLNSGWVNAGAWTVGDFALSFAANQPAPKAVLKELRFNNYFIAALPAGSTPLPSGTPVLISSTTNSPNLDSSQSINPNLNPILLDQTSINVDVVALPALQLDTYYVTVTGTVGQAVRTLTFPISYYEFTGFVIGTQSPAAIAPGTFGSQATYQMYGYAVGPPVSQSTIVGLATLSFLGNLPSGLTASTNKIDNSLYVVACGSTCDPSLATTLTVRAPGNTTPGNYSLPTLRASVQNTMPTSLQDSNPNATLVVQAVTKPIIVGNNGVTSAPPAYSGEVERHSGGR